MLACLDRGSRTLRTVERAGHFGVNLLGEGAEALARTFGRKVQMADKWRGVGWSQRDGIPALDDAIMFIGCEVRDVIGGGDHVIVTGEVRSIDEREGRPLLFADGTYRPAR
jgi:flavin reductase (DIM6/NTAB) family NADH-FMN oxidoreductase RutF